WGKDAGKAYGCGRYRPQAMYRSFPRMGLRTGASHSRQMAISSFMFGMRTGIYRTDPFGGRQFWAVIHESSVMKSTAIYRSRRTVNSAHLYAPIRMGWESP